MSFPVADDSLLCEYLDRMNNELTAKMSEETKSFYRHVFRHLYQAIQPLDYFANEMISCVMMLEHLAQWPALVQVELKELECANKLL